MFFKIIDIYRCVLYSDHSAIILKNMYVSLKNSHIGQNMLLDKNY
jgi:hypothetical protein